MFEFYPLADDPTIEQQIEAAKRHQAEEEKQIREVLKYYREKRKLKV